MRKLDELARVQPATQAPVVVPTRAGEIFRYAFFTDVLHTKSLAQTSDGHLWISDGSKTVDFNGQSFEVFDPVAGAQRVVIGIAEDQAAISGSPAPVV
jgi:hypothetical protein